MVQKFSKALGSAFISIDFR